MSYICNFFFQIFVSLLFGYISLYNLYYLGIKKEKTGGRSLLAKSAKKWIFAPAHW